MTTASETNSVMLNLSPSDANLIGLALVTLAEHDFGQQAFVVEKHHANELLLERFLPQVAAQIGLDQMNQKAYHEQRKPELLEQAKAVLKGSESKKGKYDPKEKTDG